MATNKRRVLIEELRWHNHDETTPEGWHEFDQPRGHHHQYGRLVVKPRSHQMPDAQNSGFYIFRRLIRRFLQN
jgi:hypothetical protein